LIKTARGRLEEFARMKPVGSQIVSHLLKTNDEGPHHQVGEVACAAKGEGNHAGTKFEFARQAKPAAWVFKAIAPRRGMHGTGIAVMLRSASPRTEEPKKGIGARSC